MKENKYRIDNIKKKIQHNRKQALDKTERIFPKMDNPESHAELGTQDTGRRQKNDTEN